MKGHVNSLQYIRAIGYSKFILKSSPLYWSLGIAIVRCLLIPYLPVIEKNELLIGFIAAIAVLYAIREDSALSNVSQRAQKMFGAIYFANRAIKKLANLEVLKQDEDEKMSAANESEEDKKIRHQRYRSKKEKYEDEIEDNESKFFSYLLNGLPEAIFLQLSIIGLFLFVTVFFVHHETLISASFFTFFTAFILLIFRKILFEIVNVGGRRWIKNADDIPEPWKENIQKHAEKENDRHHFILFEISRVWNHGHFSLNGNTK